jgi:nucleoside-diphosphate-sugar epimerase
MIGTVFGATGFIGRHLVAHLNAQGWNLFTPARGDPSWRNRPLGHVFYCIGLTADFRSRPFETIQAHVSQLAEIVEHADFDHFLYCSSTRVYQDASSTHETADLIVNPNRADHLYNLSKLMGESACLVSGQSGMSVVRLSNVYDLTTRSGNFLQCVLRDAHLSKHVHLKSALLSSKDYIHVADVNAAMELISSGKMTGTINLASGQNVSHAEILEVLCKATRCRVTVDEDAPIQTFPRINIERLCTFLQPSRSLLVDLPEMIAQLSSMQ